MLYEWIKFLDIYPDSKAHVTNMGPIWGRQEPGGPHVGPVNFAIWVPRYKLKSLRKLNISRRLINYCANYFILTFNATDKD